MFSRESQQSPRGLARSSARPSPRLATRACTGTPSSLDSAAASTAGRGHGDVHHVQRDERAIAQFDDLGGEVEIALEIGRIDDDDDHVRRGTPGRRWQHRPERLFVQRVRAEAVGARKVEEIEGVLGRRASAGASLRRP